MARTIDYDINVDADSALSTVGQMEDRLSELNNEIREVDVTSDAFTRLTTEVQQVNNSLEKANISIDGFTSTRRLQALRGTIDIFSGGTIAVAGLAAEFGFLGDEADETIATLLSISAAASGGATALQGVLDLREALRSSTVAQRIFNTVANLNPYIVAASVILSVAAAFVILGNDADDAAPKVSRLQNELQGINDITGLASLANVQGYVDQLRLLNSLGGIGATTSGFAELRASLASDLGLSSSQIARLVDADQDTQLQVLAQLLQMRLTENLTASERIRISQALLEIDERRARLNESDDTPRDRIEVLDSQIVATKELIGVNTDLIKSENTLMRTVMESTTTQRDVKVALAEIDRDNADEAINTAFALGDTLSAIAGESKGLAIGGLIAGSAAGIADVIVNTNVAAAKAAGQTGIFGLALAPLIYAGGALQVASIIASTASGIAQINSAPGPSAGFGGGGGGGAPAFGPTVSTPISGPTPDQTQNVNVVNQGSPVAVVAQGDIRDTNERDARTRRKSRLNRNNNG